MNIFRNFFTLKLFLKLPHALSGCATPSLEQKLTKTKSSRPLHNTTRHLSKPKKELFLGLFGFKKLQF
jgi:hypothetical protein